MNIPSEVSHSMTKKEIIEKHAELLDAFKKKVKEAEEAKKLASEAEKHSKSTAVKLSKEATVASVVENVGGLRIQIGKTLNDLTEKMNEQAEKLVSLNTAIETQEKRLAELHDIEAASDSLSKIVEAYEERKTVMEDEYSKKMKELEEEYHEKLKKQEAESGAKLEALNNEIETTRSKWKEEKDIKLKEREREEAEYKYDRDRSRKIEEDEYQEKRAALDKELKELKETREKELDEREKEIGKRETELKDLRKEVDGFAVKLEKAVQEAEEKTAAKFKSELDQKLESKKIEHEWEIKVFEERIKHLEATIASQNEKIAELKKDLNTAHTQVENIANRAVEGASLNKAFQSVNEIALEQARKPEGREEKNR